MFPAPTGAAILFGILRRRRCEVLCRSRCNSADWLDTHGVKFHFGVNIYLKLILTEPAHLSNPCKGHRIPTQSHDPKKGPNKSHCWSHVRNMHDSSVIFLGAWDLEKTSLCFLGDHPLQDFFPCHKFAR